MGWKQFKLGDLITNRDLRFKPKDNEIVGLKRIEKIDFSGTMHLSEKPSNTDMILVKRGDLVISGINVEKGAMTIYHGEEDVIATIHYSSYIVNKNKIDIEFLKSYLKSAEFVQAIKEQVPGGIKTEIKPKHLLPLMIDIPDSIGEQQDLVASLKTKNEKIQGIRLEQIHQLDLVKKFRQQILQDAVQGKLVPQYPNDEPASVLLKKIKVEKEQLILEKKIKPEKPLPAIKPEEVPFEIPESWILCRLGNIAQSIFDGPFGSNLKTVDYTGSGVQVIRLENLGKMHFLENKETFISKDKYKTIKQHTVFQGDIIIGSFLADGVNCVVLPKLKHTTIAKADCFCIRINQQLLDAKYLMYLLSSNLMHYVLSALLRGMTRLRINTTQLKNVVIPLPPLTEQCRLVTKVAHLLSLCDELEQSIKLNQEYTRQLLQVALKEALQPA